MLHHAPGWIFFVQIVAMDNIVLIVVVIIIVILLMGSGKKPKKSEPWFGSGAVHWAQNHTLKKRPEGYESVAKMCRDKCHGGFWGDACRDACDSVPGGSIMKKQDLPHGFIPWDYQVPDHILIPSKDTDGDCVYSSENQEETCDVKVGDDDDED